jgi:uncharacterized protein (TIGR02646 family)
VIKIVRAPEPSDLPAIRAAQLATVGPAPPVRTKAHTTAYQSVKPDLVGMQRHKCCYCDSRTIPDHNDVEHYRPFARYWWLAWSWDNLLFACAACNRSGGKLDAFPLEGGSIPLDFPDPPPGGERPLLLNPTVDDPRQHIEFRPLPPARWAPFGTTARGRETIRILRLDRDTYLDRFTHHVAAVVMPVVDDVWRAHATRHRVDFDAEWDRRCAQLLDPEREFRALSEDVLRHEFPTYPAPPG